MSKGLDVVAASSLWAKGKVEIPDVILSSTYVMVTTYDGDLFNPDLIPGDRQAVADVQEAIEKWGRYKLVYTAREADMILVVRTGRVLEARGGSAGDHQYWRGRHNTWFGAIAWRRGRRS